MRNNSLLGPRQHRTAVGRSRIALLALALLAGCTGTTPHWIFKAPPARGAAFPDLLFRAVPEDAAAALGLPAGTATFPLHRIRGRLVIVMVADLYCRYCQKAAPQAVALHRALTERRLTNEVRMLCIVLGNSAFEADLYRQKYAIPFPVLPDPDSQFRAALGKVGTPSFFAVRIGTDALQVVSKQAGMFETDQERRAFLSKSLEAAGLAPR